MMNSIIKEDISLQNILVPIDGSEQSFRAANHAAYLASLSKFTKTASSMTLLYIVDMNKEVSAFEQVSLGGYIPSELKNKGYDILYDLKNQLFTKAQIPINVVVKVGFPAEVIVEMAQDQDLHFSYIVMGSRGLGKLRSIFLGSVSRYVLQHAPCPVLIVR